MNSLTCTKNPKWLRDYHTRRIQELERTITSVINNEVWLVIDSFAKDGDMYQATKILCTRTGISSRTATLLLANRYACYDEC